MYDPEIIGMAQIQVLGSLRFYLCLGQQQSLALVHVSHECLSVACLHHLTFSRVSLHSGPKTLLTGTDVTQPRGLIQENGWG